MWDNGEPVSSKVLQRSTSSEHGRGAVIAAWIAQLLDVEAACRLGVFLHGAAGDHAEQTRGQSAMTAGDIAHHLGDAVAWLLDPGGDQR